MLDQHDGALIVLLAGGGVGCSLDSSPKKNWVEKSGGLPNYICKIARAIMRSGKSKSSAIAIAISRTKKWAAGGDDVDADTRAKAAKAVAQWEALKAKNKAKKVVKASRHDGTEYLELSNIAPFNTDTVRAAWNARMDEARRAARAALKARGGDVDYMDAPVPYSYIRELWTDHIIAEMEEMGAPTKVVKVPYTVEGTAVIFGEPVEVESVWQEVDDSDDLSEIESYLLRDVMVLSAAQESYMSLLSKIAQKP